ncbi:MAG: rod-binding protein [Treponema sp.]|jgi:flagellar protein FlgJ|nr:rod-binding protein [Treponema sp.]
MANDISAAVGGSPRTGGYVPFSSASPSSPAVPAGGGGLFADLLEKSRSPEAVQAARDEKKPVIDKKGKLYEQCLALETFLIKNLISGMRNTVQKSELTDTGFAGKMYEDMLYDEYAKEFTKNANFGFAEMAYLELSGQRNKIPVNRLNLV